MKRIVVCSDGTWGTPDQELPSNVTRLARAVLPTDPGGKTQVVFYDAGVGTEGFWLYRLVGAVSGRGIQKNIRDCYRFIMHNYEDGDEVYLFGFSRGAYTVRSLAGMIRNVGLLHKSDADKLQRRLPALPPFRRRAGLGRGQKSSAPLIPAKSKSPSSASGTPWAPSASRLRGLGNVPGLGRLTGTRRHQFHDVELNRGVKHACHALAIDERRCPFQGNPLGE